MKKFVVAILALVYLVTSTGATMHFHYCMGELAKTSFSRTTEPECPYCGMVKTKDSNKGCCKDEQKQVKLSQDQIATSFAKELISNAPAALPQNFTEISFPFLATIAENHPLSNSPPQPGKTPVYLKNRILRI